MRAPTHRIVHAPEAPGETGPLSARLGRRAILGSASALAGAGLVAASGCSGQSGAASSTASRNATTSAAPQREATQANPTGSRASSSASGSAAGSGTLVVYFSRAGENYWNGGRRVLDVGNTARLVQMITSRISCDTYQIVASDPYPTAYEPTVQRNVEEMQANARPAIANPLPDVQRYQSVLIGSPVWASQAPMIMSTFIEGVDLTGRRVLPFVTYAVSGMAGVDTHYRVALPKATVVDGLAVRGEQVDGSGADLDAWLRTNNLLTT